MPEGSPASPARPARRVRATPHLVRTCAELQQRFHAGKAAVTADTTDFPTSWPTRHIPNTDRPCGPAFNANGID